MSKDKFLAKLWFPRFGFSRRDDEAYAKFANSLGVTKVGVDANGVYQQLVGGNKAYIPGHSALDQQILTAEVTLAADVIVGTAAGDIGHANGATVVAAPGATRVLEFLGALLIYDHSTDDYGGGGDDLVFQNGDGVTALSAAIASADLLGASADKIVSITPLATDVPLVANKPITLKSTGWTQPGTAAGVLRVHIRYRSILTEL